jgi:hypothetical protein
MSYWRKLLIVVLLALSLPVQSFAAVSMKCVPTHADGGDAPARHVVHDIAEQHDHGIHEVALAEDGHHHDSRGAHHAHSCSTCASCCFGAALPAVSVVATPPDTTHVITRIPPSAAVASFLTGGIERPPRTTLV